MDMSPLPEPTTDWGCLIVLPGLHLIKKIHSRSGGLPPVSPPILSTMGEVSGYEIHMGVTESGTNNEALEGDGRVSDDGLVFGTYMHGLFLNPAAVNSLLSYLHSKKGLPFIPVPAGGSDPYDSLADLFEEHVNMDAIVKLLTT